MPTLALAVLLNQERQSDCQHLAERLALPLLTPEQVIVDAGVEFFLSYRDGALKLVDRQSLKKGGLQVEIDPRPGEQHSWPAPRKNVLAQAVGKKTRTVIDATTGWAQDSLALFRMGYQLRCIERSPILHELVADGFKRLSEKDWVQRRALEMPELIYGDAIALLADLPAADCIYLDPMFPPKRKKSALTKKSMSILRDILGDDLDRAQLFEAAMSAAGKRVVIKSPDYAEPLAKPDQSFHSKLLRYDVFYPAPRNALPFMARDEKGSG